MTMNCEPCRDRLDDLLDGELSAGDRQRCLEHIRQCDACREAYARARHLRTELAAMPVPSMRSAFPAEALARVKQQHRPVRRGGFVSGFAVATAASLLLWFGVTLYSTHTLSPDEEGIPSISLSVGQVQRVNLVFNSPEHMERATFTLLLPDSTELEGYPGRRELSWNVSLHKGKNRLSLPLRSNTDQPGEVIARISHGKGVKVFRLKLDVRPRVSSAAGYQQV